MPRPPVTLDLYWRDENYGSISRAFAFRASPDALLSDTADLKMRRAFGRNGFKYVESRGAWVAEGRIGTDAPVRLVTDLETLGYKVEHHHAVPHCIAQAAAESDEAEEEPAGPAP